MVHLPMNKIGARQAGLSLVELMIALVLGLFLSAGVITIFISAKQDYQVQDAVSQIQENGRFSLEFLSTDIRMAGYTGCSNVMPTANSVQNPPASLSGFGNGIEGFTGTLPAQFPDALPGTDALIVHMADTNDEFPVTNHNASAAQISIVGTHTFETGSILMIVDSDCSSRGIFVLTGPSSGTKNNAVHNTGKTFNVGGSSGVGNCTKALKGDFDCGSLSGASSTAYSDGSTVFSIRSIGYYIKDPSKVATISSPTLYRVNLGGAYLGGGATSEQPLVEGISDLEILYGVKSGNNTQYKTADVVEAADEWNDVIAVRLDVQAQSLTQVDGSPIVRNFVRTVRLRNR